MKQLNGFSASKYQPEQWVNLIKESGAKYAIITTKHHDGVSLWNSGAEKATTIPQNSLAKRCSKSFCFCSEKIRIKNRTLFFVTGLSHPYYDINTRTKNATNSK